METVSEKKRIWMFIGLVFGMSLVLIAVLYMSGLIESDPQLTSIISVAYMFFPAAASLLTRLLTQEGFKKSGLHLNFRQKGNKRFYVIAILAPVVLTLLGTAVYYLIFSGQFDINLSYARAQYEAQEAAELFDQMPKTWFFGMNIIDALFVGATYRALYAIGEELGWRGYLFPKLLKETTPAKAIIVSGTIWGFWYAPLVMMGHVYGTEYAGYPYLGILVMIFICICLSAILSYITFKVSSIVPALMFRGVLIAFEGFGYIFMKSEYDAATDSIVTTDYNALLGPLPLALIAGIPIVVFGIIILIKSKSIFLIKKDGEEDVFAAEANELGEN